MIQTLPRLRLALPHGSATYVPDDVPELQRD